jgi:hypothetical protein
MDIMSLQQYGSLASRESGGEGKGGEGGHGGRRREGGRWRPRRERHTPRI